MQVMTTSQNTHFSPQYELLRTPPFLAHENGTSRRILLLGKLEIPLLRLAECDEVHAKLSCSLKLSHLSEIFTADESIIILDEQYQAAEEFIYGHPIWASIRSGNNSALTAYILETRHYLAAAATRMTPSVSTGMGLSPITLLLSKHLLEEWDHAKFFNEALESMGCLKDAIIISRPLPSTLEWIYLSRHLASLGELNAAACSGLMEHSSVEHAAVTGWHELLVRQKLLSRQATSSIFGHFSTDIEFGHFENWKRAIQTSKIHDSRQLALILNSVCTLAEMIYRWLSALLDGCADSIVHGAQLLRESEVQVHGARKLSELHINAFSGLPVWSSAMLDVMNGREKTNSKASDLVLSLCYATAGSSSNLHPDTNPLVSLLNETANGLGKIDVEAFDSAEAIDGAVSGWLRTIDGHKLWAEMTDEGNEHLAIGYMVENFHYLASATRHISPAIASCHHSLIRESLLRHLEDELTHCNIIRSRLQKVGIQDVSRLRPLPTTTAFVGYLCELARHDWKAYIISGAYLQKSLSECRSSGRHLEFYKKAVQMNPKARDLFEGMLSHDDIDESLGHDINPLERCRHLTAEGPVPLDSVEKAAVLPLLAWGFLDGIREHYIHGLGSIKQRVAWTE